MLLFLVEVSLNLFMFLLGVHLLAGDGWVASSFVFLITIESQPISITEQAWLAF